MLQKGKSGARVDVGNGERRNIHSDCKMIPYILTTLWLAHCSTGLVDFFPCNQNSLCIIFSLFLLSRRIKHHLTSVDITQSVGQWNGAYAETGKEVNDK